MTGGFETDGGVGIRTPDLLNAIETRSQLRYTPVILVEKHSVLVPAIIQPHPAVVKQTEKSPRRIETRYRLAPVVLWNWSRRFTGDLRGRSIDRRTHWKVSSIQ